MLAIAPGWELEVSRGPDWLWIKVERPEALCDDTPPLAEEIWTQLERHFVYRLVLELDEVESLDSYLLGQLLMLGKRVSEHGGMLRLSGVNAFNREISPKPRPRRAIPHLRQSDRSRHGNVSEQAAVSLNRRGCRTGRSLGAMPTLFVGMAPNFCKT